jgi:hypothetical protein
MARIIKRVQTFFLLLAVFILNAHMIIPHDHHQGDEDLCQSNSCPASKSNPGRRTGLPLHCHAFNDLTSEKAITYHTVKHIVIRNFAFCCIPDKQVYYLQLSCINVFDPQYKPVIPGLQDLISLRAPPSFI